MACLSKQRHSRVILDGFPAVLVVEVNTTRDVSFITLQIIFRPNQLPLSISVFFCLCIANGCTLSSSRNGSWSRFIICCLTAENTPQSKRYSQTAVSMWRGHILLLPSHNDGVLSYLRGLSNYYKGCGSRHLVIGSILTILKHLTPYATATCTVVWGWFSNLWICFILVQSEGLLFFTVTYGEWCFIVGEAP